jgi:hypothetical protein
LRDAISRNRTALVISLIILVLLTAMYPAARWLDGRTDSKRPLYQDRELAVWLLYEEHITGGTIAATTIAPGDTVKIGSANFQPSPGDTVEVKLDNTKYCVQVTSASGHHTSWQCWGLDVKPPQPNDTTINY